MPIILPPDPPATPPVDNGTVTTAGQDLYDRLAPLATYDEDNGYVVRALAETLATPQQIVDDIARDTETQYAWQPALDPDTARAELLPWQSQFAGTRLLPSDTQEQQRDRIKQAAGFYRGTPRAIEEETARTLTGAQVVLVLQRVGGDPWAITVATRTSETPDAAAAERAARAQKPAGMLMTFTVSDDPIWDEADVALTWDAVGAGVTWDTVMAGDV